MSLLTSISSLPLPTKVAAAGFALLALILFKQLNKPNKNLPPGPPADPLIGHVRILPLSYSWETFAEWGKKYGDVIYVHAFGRPMVIVNSYMAAREMMDKKGANFSDRPRLVLFSEMMGWGAILAFLPYGDRFRRQRRLVQNHFNQQAVAAYQPVQQKEIYGMVNRLMKTPEEFVHHIHRAVSSTLVMTTYGHEVKSADDKFIQLVESATAMTVGAGPPGGMPVDFLPWLAHIPEWFPGAGFKRHALKTRKIVDKMLNQPFDAVKEGKSLGTAKQSLILDLLEKYDSEDPDMEADMKSVGGVMYGAGVETTEATTATFFMFMTRYPNFAKRAQEEIDLHVGKERLPTLEDRKDLPYIDCIMRELLRYNPPVPMGIPHASMTEDTYRGMTIPAKSMVIPNIWGMMRDERYYPEPAVFNPDRFVHLGSFVDEKLRWTKSDTDEETNIHAAAADPFAVVYGFGRRACPGRYFADAGIWLTMATVLSVFDISPEVDPQTGKPVYPSCEFTSGTTCQPKPFKCKITPRGEYAKNLVARETAHIM